jgi:hypothetical protein
VGDHSKYVTTLAQALRELVPRIRDSLRSDAYFRMFCDRFAKSFVARFQDVVFRCKRPSEMGSQQLLLDAQAVRSVLLKLPLMDHPGKERDEPPAAASSFAVYAKSVNAEMQRIEVLLKLAGMSLSPNLLVESFRTLLVDGNTEDLRLVLEMKGIKRADQQATVALAEAQGVPKGTPSAAFADLAGVPVAGPGPAASASGVASSFATSVSAAAAASTTSAPASASALFSKMSDMSETLGKVASSSASGKGFSSLSASLSQSYNRAVNKKPAADK